MKLYEIIEIRLFRIEGFNYTIITMTSDPIDSIVIKSNFITIKCIISRRIKSDIMKY